jgi:hypothetical protein
LENQSGTIIITAHFFSDYLILMIRNNYLKIMIGILLTGTNIPSSKAQFGWFKKREEPVDTTTTKTSYNDLVSDAKIDSGVINVIKKKTDYYFELDTALLNRDFLVVNKLSQVPYPLNDAGLNKGMDYEDLLIQFSYNPDLEKVFILNYKSRVDVSPDQEIAKSVRDNFRKSILETFDVKTFNTDSSAIIINVNKIYNGKEKSLSNIFGVTGIGTSPNTDLSYISTIKSFDSNIVAKSVLTTKIPGAETAASLTVEVTSNMVLLSKKPMTPRFADPRAGFFTTPKWYFNDDQQKLEKRKLITRWKLIPADKEAYARGELTTPEKPIVFYIDPATPRQWRSYIKRGVEEWNVAFEQAGFKNAIVCKEIADTADFDLDDVRFSGITYAASEKANAMGPSVVDPRSGEILEADIMWWHNVMGAVQSWMRVQTGIIDPKSRGNDFDTEHMGEAIRFICSHEVGHTLGLKHNMGASSTYPVDSLRSPSFTDKHATAPSIMDYARFNYVARPGDGVTMISPQIGDYDKFAIEWGYRYYGEGTPWENLPKEKALVAKALKNPYCTYLPQQDVRTAIDPRAQSEDLGDNSVEASRYGLANLKQLMPRIISWTTKENEDYTQAGKLLNAVIGQWFQYAYHVLTNVGGVYIDNATLGDGHSTYTFVPAGRQREAVSYLIDEVITSPAWLFKSPIYQYVYPLKNTPNGLQGVSATATLQNAQSYVLWDLLTNERLSRMLEAESQLGKEHTYTVVSLLDQLHQNIFADTKKGKSLTIDQRAAQKAFVDALIIAVDRSVTTKVKKDLYEQCDLNFPAGAFPGCCNQYHLGDHHAVENHIFKGPLRASDAISLKRGELLRIENLLKQKRHTGDWATQSHYEDILLRINQSLR